MAASQIDNALLDVQLAEFGLIAFGWFEITPEHTGDLRPEFAGRRALLVGNAGPTMFEIFSQSAEYADGIQDPMNRWTRRIIDALASECGADAIYPFEEPYWPFQRFASAATGLKQSPIGLLIHPEYGLWQAYRAAMIFPENANQNKVLEAGSQELIHPCEACVHRPCLNTCPVNAFQNQTIHVHACMEHLESGNEPHCMSLGCAARNACPVGREYRYDETQLAFHMQSFRNARLADR